VLAEYQHVEPEIAGQPHLLDGVGKAVDHRGAEGMLVRQENTELHAFLLIAAHSAVTRART